MTRMGTIMELQPADRHNSQEAGNDQRRGAPPDSNVLMDQILEDMSTIPHEEVLKRIASRSDIRRGKVLNIYRKITKGTYEVAGRLDRVVDRILKSISA